MRPILPGQSAATTRLSLSGAAKTNVQWNCAVRCSSGISVNSYNNLALFAASLFVHPQNVPSKHRVYHLMHPLLSPNRPLEQVAQEFLQSFLPSAEHFLQKSFLFPQHQVMRDNLSMSERHSQQHQNCGEFSCFARITSGNHDRLLRNNVLGLFLDQQCFF